jgi:UDP-glucose 4-epimerase
LGLNPEIHFGREKRGWVGDNPFIFLDTKKIRNLGWSEMKTIEESIRDTVKFLRSNEWLFLKSEAK